MGQFAHRCQSPPTQDTRPVGLLEDRFHEDLSKLFHRIAEGVIDRCLAFDYWVQVFLIALLRDHGIVSNIALRDLREKRDASGITKELNRILNDHFIPIQSRDFDLIWDAYSATLGFCTRLNLLPIDMLGFGYEQMLKCVQSGTKTSVYTPEDLAIGIIKRLSITPEDTILDCAAGTGTLLCIAAEEAWKGRRPTSSEEVRRLAKFFAHNIIAIDRDPYALKCCKAMLLSTYVKILDREPSELRPNWCLPKLCHMHHGDLFETRLDKTVDVALGNPPWGNIDAENNPIGLSERIRTQLRSQHSAIYRDDTDTSTYVLKHVLEGKLCHLSPRFRAGFLIKQQILTNKSSDPFRRWAAKNSLKFIDHGNAVRFSRSPGSLVAECFYKVPWVGNAILTVRPTAVPNVGIPLEQLIVAAKGFESGRLATYERLAERYADVVIAGPWIKPVYPTAAGGEHIVWDVTRSGRVFFVPRGVVFPKDIALTMEEKSELSQRKDVAAKYPYSWRGCEKLEAYGKDMSCPRIFMPRQPSARPAGRVLAGIDRNGEGIGTSGQSIWLKKPKVSTDTFFCIAGWANSKYFLRQLDAAKVTRSANGYRLEPNEVYKLRIPEWVICDRITRVVGEIVANRSVTEADLHEIDQICEQAN